MSYDKEEEEEEEEEDNKDFDAVFLSYWLFVSGIPQQTRRDHVSAIVMHP